MLHACFLARLLGPTQHPLCFSGWCKHSPRKGPKTSYIFSNTVRTSVPGLDGTQASSTDFLCSCCLGRTFATAGSTQLDTWPTSAPAYRVLMTCGAWCLRNSRTLHLPFAFSLQAVLSPPFRPFLTSTKYKMKRSAWTVRGLNPGPPAC